MNVTITYTAHDGKTIDQEQVLDHLQAIKDDPEIMSSMDQDLLVFLISRHWVNAEALKMASGRVRIRHQNPKGLSSAGNSLLFANRG